MMLTTWREGQRSSTERASSGMQQTSYMMPNFRNASAAVIPFCSAAIMFRSPRTFSIAPANACSTASAGTDQTDGIARTLLKDQLANGSWFAHHSMTQLFYFETAYSIIMLHRTVV